MIRHLPTLQKHHPRDTVMLSRKNILTKLTIAFILFYAYLPVYLFFDHDLHQPFKFYHVDGGITWYHYTDYLCARVSVLILVYVIVELEPKFREYLFTFFLLWVGYFAEFILVFNQPFGMYHSIPISYSLGAGLSMIALTFIKWKRKL